MTATIRRGRPVVADAGEFVYGLLGVVLLQLTAAVLRFYSGSAPVGDFWTVALDARAGTLTYRNNAIADATADGAAGVLPATLVGGVLTAVADASGNVVGVLEVPDTALLLNVTKAGPAGDQASLVVCVVRAPFVPSAVVGVGEYNYLQFRTKNGGGGIGTASVNADGDLVVTAY